MVYKVWVGSQITEAADVLEEDTLISQVQ